MSPLALRSGELRVAALPILVGISTGLALHNGPVAAVLCALGASLPLQLRRWRGQHRRKRLLLRMVPCLEQLAALFAVQGHPLPALHEVAAHLDGPLGEELRAALKEYHAGTPLPVALHRLADREGDDFYLHQLAALVEVHLHQGTDLEAALLHLSQRLHLSAELLAEQQAEIGLYRAVSWSFFLVSLLPIGWWWLTGAPALGLLTDTGGGRLLLAWVVISGLAVAWAPSLWEVREP